MWCTVIKLTIAGGGVKCGIGKGKYIMFIRTDAALPFVTNQTCLHRIQTPAIHLSSHVHFLCIILFTFTYIRIDFVTNCSWDYLFVYQQWQTLVSRLRIYTLYLLESTD